MATRIWNSAVIEAPIDQVWAELRSFKFAWNPLVTGTDVEEKKSASEVGAVLRVSYKDKTVQRLKVVEISDLTHTLSWDLIESVPHVTVLSASHTVKLRRISETNTVFIEWTTDFSKDADATVTADASYKQKENFTSLNKLFASRKSAPVGLVGGAKVIYSAEKAAEGVRKIWADLETLTKASNTELNHQAFMTARQQYLSLPVTYQVDWAVAGLDAAAAQRVADGVRDRLNARGTAIGYNGLPLPRLFNAGS